MAALTEQAHAQNERWYSTSLAVTSDAFLLKGGLYGVTVAGSGFGTATLQRLAADASTYVTCLTAFSAAGYSTVSLPPGTYKVAISSATVSVDITAIARAG